MQLTWILPSLYCSVGCRMQEVPCSEIVLRRCEGHPIVTAGLSSFLLLRKKKDKTITMTNLSERIVLKLGLTSCAKRLVWTNTKTVWKEIESGFQIEGLTSNNPNFTIKKENCTIQTSGWFLVDTMFDLDPNVLSPNGLLTSTHKNRGWFDRDTDLLPPLP